MRWFYSVWEPAQPLYWEQHKSLKKIIVQVSVIVLGSGSSKTQMVWKWSFCFSLPNKYCTAAASLQMVSCMDHPSSQHSPFAIRTASWLAINGAPLPVFTLFLPSYTSLIQLPFSFFASTNYIPTVSHFVTECICSWRPFNLRIKSPNNLFTSCHDAQPFFFQCCTFGQLVVTSSSVPWYDSVTFTSYCCHLVLHFNQHMYAHAKRKKKGLGCAAARRWANSNGSSSCSHTLSNTQICFRHPPGAALKVELFVVIIVVMFVL